MERHLWRAVRLPHEERGAGVGADERLLERDGIGPMLRDEPGDSVEDRLQSQLRPFSGGGLPPPVVDGLEAPVAFVDDAVPARSRPRIDADDLHGQRLGSDPDVSFPAEAPFRPILNITFTNGLPMVVCSDLYPARTRQMQLRKVIQRRIRRSGEGVDLVGDVNAAISANVGEKSSSSHVSSRSSASAYSHQKEEPRDETQGRETA